MAMTLPRVFHFYYLLVFSFCCFSCKDKRLAPVVTRSYYFWRNNSDVTTSEKEYLRSHQVRKVYAKCLDIDWSEKHQAIPLTINRVYEIDWAFHHFPDTLDVQVVPVVFITNRTLEETDSSQLPLLATRLLRKCIPGFDSLSIPGAWGDVPYTIPKEIQFDCDWSVGTRNKYFYLLQCVREKLWGKAVQLSATIRLHQFKYPSKTGVPPVDRGMLMVYNIGKLTEYTATNSIYDNDKAKAYFTSSKGYALPLDIALPAYSWGIVFRQGKFMMIDNGLSANQLKGTDFLVSDRPSFYKVIADTVYRDVYLRPGDEIKIEHVDEKTLLQAAEMAGRAINTDSFSVALFELSEQEIQNYRHETIEQVFTSFER